MSFLYRNKDLGPVGDAGSSVMVQDRPEVTVISVGIIGEFGTETTMKGINKLQEVLSAQDTWETNGDPRIFNYNDPFTKLKWNEV